jgi:hypothetical protein
MNLIAPLFDLSSLMEEYTFNSTLCSRAAIIHHETNVNRSFGKYILSLLSASYNPCTGFAVFFKHEIKKIKET